MNRAISRAAFLRADLLDRTVPNRPPWSVDERAFTSCCDRCGKCLTSCPESILVAGRGGFPEVDFGRGECTFCARCADICPTGALTAATPWTLKAAISEACFSARGVVCRLCEERCAPRAIRFRLRPGGRAVPEVDKTACSGCGACYGVCPAGAIEMREDPQ